MWIKPHEGKLLNLDCVERIEIETYEGDPPYFQVKAIVTPKDGAETSPHCLTGRVSKKEATETHQLIADGIKHHRPLLVLAKFSAPSTTKALS